MSRVGAGDRRRPAAAPGTLGPVSGHGGAVVPGTRVQLVRRSALQGLLEVEVRGSRLSLRSAEAHQVAVEAADG